MIKLIIKIWYFLFFNKIKYNSKSQGQQYFKIGMEEVAFYD
jgi:hypothetical protein